jgi:phospholipid/cholesterol/gamma-HCH transport system ATP-binding protein
MTTTKRMTGIPQLRAPSVARIKAPTTEEHPEPPVSVRGLKKSFNGNAVLNGIDLSLAPGETIAILGRSGTGKSVFLKLVIGLQLPDAGSIRVHGSEIPDLSTRELNEVRKKVGFVFQRAALYDSLTVEENVAFPLRRHTQISGSERRDRVRELLSSVGMEEHLAKLPSEISGGMQKRVGLARALALEPDVLLLDEPTAGLDPITAAEIGNLIAGLKNRRETSAIVVTHDVLASRVFADRFVMLDQGAIIAEGSLRELSRSSNDFIVRFLQGCK